MALIVCLISCLIFGYSLGGPALFDGYVKCTDGSSPQKDAGGHTLACQPGQQTYTPCQTGYQCATPLPGRPGVCCAQGYVAATPGPQTYAPPVPPAETVPPPPPQETVPPPPPDTPPPALETIPPPPETAAPPVMTDPPPVMTDPPPVMTDPPPVMTDPPPVMTDPPPVMTDPPQVDTTMNMGGGGIEQTPPPPTDFTGHPVDGGAGGVPPEVETTTMSIDSIPVVTDSSGAAMVSPQSSFENRKSGNRTAADAHRFNGQGKPNPNSKHPSPAQPVHGANGAKPGQPKPSNSTVPVVIKIVTTPVKASTASYPLKNGQAAPARRFSDLH